MILNFLNFQGTHDWWIYSFLWVPDSNPAFFFFFEKNLPYAVNLKHALMAMSYLLLIGPLYMEIVSSYR